MENTYKEAAPSVTLVTLQGMSAPANLKTVQGSREVRLESRAVPRHRLRNESGRADAVWKRPEALPGCAGHQQRAGVLETGLGLGCGGETLPNVINYKQTNTCKQGSGWLSKYLCRDFGNKQPCDLSTGVSKATADSQRSSCSGMSMFENQSTLINATNNRSEKQRCLPSTITALQSVDKIK